MLTNLDNWLNVQANSALLDAVRSCNLDDVAAMSTLRKSWALDEISIAAELVGARRRAKGKLENAEAILADSVGVQQATSTRIARHKAMRFVSDGPIFDLCCGIGSDLRHLPKHTVGIDIDPLRCMMACENSGKRTTCADVREVQLTSDALIHIDPSRRISGKRAHALSEMQPSLAELTPLLTACAGGCIKVSPSIEEEDLSEFELEFELEYIEEHGRVVQCLIWFGTLANHAGLHTATSMTLNESRSGTPEFPAYRKNIEGWILEPNPALERARLHTNLANECDASELSPNLGLFCAKLLPDTNWFTTFKVLDTTPMRRSHVAQALRALGCTQVEVKTRGKTIDPNEWQNKLTTKSSGELLSVFALRLGSERVAIITRRC